VSWKKIEEVGGIYMGGGKRTCEENKWRNLKSYSISSVEAQPFETPFLNTGICWSMDRHYIQEPPSSLPHCSCVFAGSKSVEQLFLILKEASKHSWIGGWVSPRVGLDAGATRKIVYPCRGRTSIIQSVVRHYTKLQRLPCHCSENVILED
jgi:hypothetical protein